MKQSTSRNINHTISSPSVDHNTPISETDMKLRTLKGSTTLGESLCKWALKTWVSSYGFIAFARHPIDKVGMFVYGKITILETHTTGGCVFVQRFLCIIAVWLEHHHGQVSCAAFSPDHPSLDVDLLQQILKVGM